MTVFRDGETFRVFYSKGAKVCEHCYEYNKYDAHRTGIMVKAGSEELELVIHKSWEDCSTMYATLEDDDGGGIGDYLIVAWPSAEPMDCSHDDFKCAGQQRLEGEEV
tara:strand:- start:1002 stop:1322 length:321 start_codon:yes stop_codon:yes gene_type:complete